MGSSSRFLRLFFFFIFLSLFFFKITLQAQICSSYMLVPDTVLVNVSSTFEIQPSTGGSTPPSLWICNWIDFNADSTFECLNITSCQYSFNTGGNHIVTYQINEPFLNNTEVCTSFVYVNACNAALNALANNQTDTLGVCVGENVIIKADLADVTSCSGIWQYTWSNGNFYYDGIDFLSFNEVWNSNFQQININSFSTNTSFKVKARCSAFPNCKDSSSVYVFIKQAVQTPFFNPLLDTSRCQDGDTLYVFATATYSDSVIYTIDPVSLAAGNQINPYSGLLIFDSLYTGNTSITVTAYGCSGPKTISHQILSRPLPDVAFFLSDTSYMCMGDDLIVPVQFVGAYPFQLKCIINNFTQFTGTYLTSNTNITLPYINQPEVTLIFFELSDKYCTRNIDNPYWVFATPKPIFNNIADTTICADASITLDPGVGYQYLWLPDSLTNQSITIDTSNAAINIGTNTIYLEVTNGYCTIKDTILLTFTVCASLIENKSNFDFEIYPNPSSGDIKILLPESSSKFFVEIFNVAGQTIYNNIITPSDTYFKKLKLNNKGIFYIKISKPDGVAAIKKVILY